MAEAVEVLEVDRDADIPSCLGVTTKKLEYAGVEYWMRRIARCWSKVVLTYLAKVTLAR